MKERTFFEILRKAEGKALRKIDFTAAVKNIRSNVRLLISAAAALCLFSAPSLVSAGLIAGVFLALTAAAAFFVLKPADRPGRFEGMAALVLTLAMAFLGFASFWDTWILSSKLTALAGAVGLTGPVLLSLMGLAGCVVGSYAMYILSRRTILWAEQALDQCLPAGSEGNVAENLKRNWFFPVSAAAFFWLNEAWDIGYAAGAVISVLAAFAVCGRIPSVRERTKGCDTGLRLFSAATAAGLCVTQWEVRYVNLLEDWTGELAAQAAEGLPGLLAAAAAMAAVYFVYCCVLAFWSRMIKICSGTGLFRGVKTWEWILYGLLLALSVAFMVLCFERTDAFYGTEFPYDIIYTSDSPMLVKGSVYAALTHPQNDLRQPLFALFAAPFTGIAYLAGGMTGASAGVRAMLVNGAQILMLLTANFMVARMMKLDRVKRVCFMVLSCCTYTQLLFILMMEQYIVAYFWLIFCIYLIAEKGQPPRLALWGAGGTLLTSMILMPFLSGRHPIRDLKGWFLDMVKYGMEFAAVMLVFCRFDVLFGLVSKVSFLGGFTGKTVTVADKVFQYTRFIRDCFAGPAAGVSTAVTDWYSWQLDTPDGICAAGVVLLLLAAVSAVWNRRDKSCLLAAGWIGFSLVMLLGLGWGTAENGLILYALYFGWAFLVLLFRLAEKIGDCLGIRAFLPIAAGCGAMGLLAVNIPAMAELLKFAVTYYPA